MLCKMYFPYQNIIVINDATNIIDLFESYGMVDIKKSNCKNYDYDVCTNFYLCEEERFTPFIMKNGKIYINMDSPHIIIEKIPPSDDLYKNNK